jgi:alpha-L-rhamnosidase
VFSLLTFTPALADTPGIRIDGLRCEHLVNPAGIDIVHPRLRWILNSSDRGQSQTAYRVLVASSEAALAADHGDLWDTGRRISDRSIELPYEGKPLKPRQAYWWKVRVWDVYGRASDWSRSAFWSMGLLNPSDWRGKWIGYTPAPANAGNAPLSLEGSRWIWLRTGSSGVDAPAGKVLFVRALDIPHDFTIRTAQIAMSVDDQFVLQVNGHEALRSSGADEDWRTIKTADLVRYLHPGSNSLLIEGINASASPAGLILKIRVESTRGQTVTLTSDAQWSAGEVAMETPALRARSLTPARDLGPFGMAPWGRLGGGDWSRQPSSPLLRKEFAVGGKVRRATLSICGLGYYEARINGAKVGDHVLDPTFTRYDRRVLYTTYNVTHMLQPGTNAIGVMLANGFFNQYSRDAWNFSTAPWRANPRLRAQLDIDYVDGTHAVLPTDTSWRGSSGPVVHDGIRNGEAYDARQEKPGWDLPGYTAEGWHAAQTVDAPRGALRAEMVEPIKVTQNIRPVKVTQPRPGVFIFDMGQAFAGWARLKVTGPAGTKVTMRFGERLDQQGMLTTPQISGLVFEGPFQTAIYTLKGHGTEEWEPRFAYFGYRYVEVTGFPGTPTIGNLTGRVVHTAFQTEGGFTCSNPLLNAIQKLTLWSYRSNFVGIPTDCPHREKNGWTGDAELASEQAMFNWNNVAAYEQWMNDFKDEQRSDGNLPGIVPTGGWGYDWGNGPPWDSAYIIIPWNLYLYQGDVRVLADQYAGMKRYVDFLTAHAKDHIIDFGLGDWVPYRTETPVAVTSTGYYYADAVTLARAATILRKKKDALTYQELAEQIRAAFEKHFIRDGKVANGSQTALSCAVYQGIATGDERSALVASLVANLEHTDNHIDTGILGAKYLFRVLSANGQHDLAYKVATQTTEPSYGDWIRHGATTLWEDWKGTSSLDHIMFGDISAWFYQTLAGLNADPDAPGFKHFTVRPQIPITGDLTYVRAWHNSPYGRVESDWKRGREALVMRVTVPVGTTAEVFVPCANPARVSEAGSPASSRNVRFVGSEAGYAQYHVGSGSYEFRSGGLVPRP